LQSILAERKDLSPARRKKIGARATRRRSESGVIRHAVSRIIKIRLKKSTISTPQQHKNMVLSLGLRKLGRVVERPDTPAFRGMVAKVSHLLEIVG